jgi:hypothetical protein
MTYKKIRTAFLIIALALSIEFLREEAFSRIQSYLQQSGLSGNFNLSSSKFYAYPPPYPPPLGTNNVFFPYIVKWGPTSGFWQSAAGYTQFYVSPDLANVLKFQITVNLPGCGVYNIWRTIPAPISNYQFSFNGGLYASGTFDSATTAHGTCGLQSIGPICGYYWTGGPVSWSTTWQNNSQPTALSADLIGYRFVESAPEIKGVYTAIPVK